MSIELGDYVLATKYGDGDPFDHWCVGFLQGYTTHLDPRFIVVNNNGVSFRHSGFRRAEKITQDEGNYLLSNCPRIKLYFKSLWSWLETYRKQVDNQFHFGSRGSDQREDGE